MLQMLYQPETCRVCKVTIPLLFLQISDLFTVPTRFYESLNEQNQMCELCMFSQIRSQILMVLYILLVYHIKNLTFDKYCISMYKIQVVYLHVIYHVFISTHTIPASVTILYTTWINGKRPLFLNFYNCMYVN